MRAANYKATPKGCGGLSTNTPKNAKNGGFFDLDELIASGNRATRRFASKQLKQLKKSRGE